MRISCSLLPRNERKKTFRKGVHSFIKVLKHWECIELSLFLVFLGKWPTCPKTHCALRVCPSVEHHTHKENHQEEKVRERGRQRERDILIQFRTLRKLCSLLRSKSRRNPMASLKKAVVKLRNLQGRKKEPQSAPFFHEKPCMLECSLPSAKRDTLQRDYRYIV